MAVNELYTCYYIKNKFNGKIYVGVTNDYKSRIANHYSALKSRTHINPHLQFDYDQLKDYEFPFESGILEENIPQNKRFTTEYMYMKKLNTLTVENGYNFRGYEDFKPLVASDMGKQIIEFRKKHKLTRKQFCEMSNVSTTLIRNIENGIIEKPKWCMQLGRIERFLAADSASKGE